jgi:hypothetical protein
MKFTAEHVEILEQHRGDWETLKTSGFMRNMDRDTFDQLQNIHNEALGPAQYTHWCAVCVADMVRILYTNYDKWANKVEGGTPAVTNSGRGPRKKK